MSSSRAREQRDQSDSGSSSSESGILNPENEEGWEDAEPEETSEQYTSLIDDEVFSSITEMLQYCKTKDLDFLSLRNKFSLDFYGSIQLVNYIRSQVKAGEQVTTSDITETCFKDEKYLKLVLPDDAVIIGLDDLPAVENNSSEPLLSRVAELEEELKKTQSQFAEYRETVNRTLDQRWNENAPTTSSSSQEPPKVRDDDSHYFSSYSYNDIHETMLKDTVRTDAYRDFIYQHKNLFANKVVLDVGCGTGILSMFCAKAGASHVYAVDNSAIIQKARENIFTNGLSSRITCLHGKMEEITLPVPKVDIIVSEWMGYCLLYEAMLDSVIWARDKYLAPDGLMVPSHMNMWVAPIHDPEYVEDHITFWRDVYGFDMKAMQAGIFDEGLVLHMPEKTIVGEPYMFRQLSLHETTVKDLTFRENWKSTLTQDVDSVDGFCVWFDTFFMTSRKEIVDEQARAESWNGKGVAFTTGPYAKETHWRQGVLLIDGLKEGSAEEQRKKGDVVSGELEYSVPEDNSRALDVKISWNKMSASVCEQSWKMK